MPWDLTWLEFFKGFWPNFVAAIVTGGIIGVFFSWWITKKIGNELNTKERQLVILSEKLEKNITIHGIIKVGLSCFYLLIC